ncbi:MAG: hypothetical protein CUN55_12600 [Phototrophicales bacterium]|nr:MAG: hypothetical protein CUN55_12600 [Phototrophicales bacterium]
MNQQYDETIFNAPTPVLRFVPTDSLLPHEEHDHQRSAPLIQRVVESGIWLHPPIVTPLHDGSGRYVVLDGANRCHVIQHLGYPHILVQIVDYESDQVFLDRWNHVLTQMPTSTLLERIRALKHVELRESDLLEAQAELAQRDALVYLVELATDAVFLAYTDERTIKTRTERLRDIVNCYKSEAKLDRINTDKLEQVRYMYPKASTFVAFPRYEPSEILYAAREQVLLPPGISRHIIHGRAMRLLYPLHHLADTKTPLEEKNQDLEEWVQSRIDERAVRFYAESSYVFDD